MTDKAKAGEQSPAKYTIESEPTPEFLEDVASWFRHPQGKPWPTPDMVIDLVERLELCKRVKQNREKIRNSLKKDIDLYENITRSIDILEQYASHQIIYARNIIIRHEKYLNKYETYDWQKETIESIIERTNEELDDLRSILYYIGKIKNHDNVKNYFILVDKKRKKGRRRIWARDAGVILRRATSIWEQAGRTKRLSISQTGPLVHVLVQALEYIGWDVNEAGISKWLEERRKKPKKSRANSSSHGPENMHHKNASRR